MEEKQDWQEIVSKKRRIQRDLLNLHANSETHIASYEDANNATNVTAISELTAKLSRGELDCESVMKGYISRLVRRLLQTCLRRRSVADDCWCSYKKSL
jgi:hypothetical protein